MMQAKDLKNRGLGYLATVYTQHPEGLDKAFMDASKLAGVLLMEGLIVFSPIAHTHPIAMASGIDPLDHNIWLEFDEPLLARCDYLMVAKMANWEKSKGIAHETKRFTQMRKPIYHLSMDDLSVVRLLTFPPKEGTL